MWSSGTYVDVECYRPGKLFEKYCNIYKGTIVMWLVRMEVIKLRTVFSLWSVRICSLLPNTLLGTLHSRSQQTIRLKSFHNYGVSLRRTGSARVMFARGGVCFYIATLSLLSRRWHSYKHTFALPRVLILLLLLVGDITCNPGPTKQRKRRQAQKQQYLFQRELSLSIRGGSK